MSTTSNPPTPREPRTFGSDFRRFFGRGLAILLPSILTLWILWQAFAFVFANVAAPINSGLRSAVVVILPAILDESNQPEWFRVSEQEALAAAVARNPSAPPASLDRLKVSELHRLRAERLRAQWDSRWYLEGTGLVVAIILIYLAGVLLGGLIGRRVYTRLESLIRQIPGFKQVYPHVKQLVELIIGERPLAFKRVVLVEYPRRGVWTLGLVTSDAMRVVSERGGGPCVTVFIPSTPTPFTGFTISVPESDVMDLPISIDEALRFVLTGGVLIPERQAAASPSPAIAEMVRQIDAAHSAEDPPHAPQHPSRAPSTPGEPRPRPDSPQRTH